MKYLVHGEGFAEIEEAPTPQAAIHNFRVLAQEVNEGVDMWKVKLVAEPADVDDDPVCWCGTHRSEHLLCGCPDGFEAAR